MVDVVGNAVVCVIAATRVVHGAQVKPRGRVYGHVDVVVDVLNGALPLVLLHHRRRMERPKRDVPLEGEKCRLWQEEPQLVEISGCTPSNNGTDPEVMTQIRMAIKKVVADVTDQEDDQFIFVRIVAEENVLKSSFGLRPFRLKI